MEQPLYRYLAKDHDRLDKLLAEATSDPDEIKPDAYADFRKGLLRHISIEEKIVLPAIARFQNGRQADVAQRLRLDHGAIVALLVPPPSPSIVATLRSILGIHNNLEEGQDGLYLLLERLAGDERMKLFESMRSAPDIPVLPHNSRPDILEVTRRAVERAGYDFNQVPPK